MRKTRHGKIARLPLAVREELNRRLRNGEEGKMLVGWLNSLPEVREIVAAMFGGKAVREQNLSEWRKGGYQDWLERESALELAERLGDEGAKVAEKEGEAMTDILARWVVARYAVATREIVAAESGQRWRMLREMCADFVKLREGDHRASRLELARRRAGITAGEVGTGGAGGRQKRERRSEGESGRSE